MHLNFITFLGVFSILTLGTTPAFADEPARTAVMRAAVASPALESLSGPVGRVVRARVEELRVVRAADTPAATFADLQLAVGCLSESMDCYRTVASQLGVEALLLTTLDEVAGGMVLTIAFADTRGEGGTRRVTRTFQGEDRDNQVLNAIGGMLHELYDVEPPPDRPVVEAGDATTGDALGDTTTSDDTLGDTTLDTPIEQPPEESSFPTASVVVGAIGLVALAAGVGVGVASSGTADEYAAAPTRTPGEVDAALALQSKGERQALSANVLFAVGGVAVVSSLLLYFLVDRDHDQVTASVEAGPDHATLTFAGRFGGAL